MVGVVVVEAGEVVGVVGVDDPVVGMTTWVALYTLLYEGSLGCVEVWYSMCSGFVICKYYLPAQVVGVVGVIAGAVLIGNAALQVPEYLRAGASGGFGYDPIALDIVMALVGNFPFGVKRGASQEAFVPHRLPPNDTILLHQHQKSSAFCVVDSYHPVADMWLRRDGVGTGAVACLMPDPDTMALDSPEGKLDMNVESIGVQFQSPAQYDHYHGETVSRKLVPRAAHWGARSMSVGRMALCLAGDEHNGVVVGVGHWESADLVMCSVVFVGVKPELLLEIAAHGGLDVGASAVLAVPIDPQSRHPPTVGSSSQTPPPATFDVRTSPKPLEQSTEGDKRIPVCFFLLPAQARADGEQRRIVRRSESGRNSGIIIPAAYVLVSRPQAVVHCPMFPKAPRPNSKFLPR